VIPEMRGNAMRENKIAQLDVRCFYLKKMDSELNIYY